MGVETKARNEILQFMRIYVKPRPRLSHLGREFLARRRPNAAPWGNPN